MLRLLAVEQCIIKIEENGFDAIHRFDPNWVDGGRSRCNILEYKSSPQRRADGEKQKSPEAPKTARLDFELPEGQRLPTGTASVLAISPDGRSIAYSTSKGLYLRSLGDSTVKLVPGTEGGAREPFFSPDGKWIGYVSIADRKLKKSPIDGGAPVALTDLPLPITASPRADKDNAVVYVRMLLPADVEKMAAQSGATLSPAQLRQVQQAIREIRSEVVRLPADGGNAASILGPRSGGILSPMILPGGKTVLYAVAGSASATKILVQSITGEPKELIVGAQPVYLLTGHILYSQGNTLFALPFDLDKLAAAGKPMAVVQNVRPQQFSVSDTGTLAYIPYVPAQNMLVWVDREGKEEPVGAPNNAYAFPKISPDGTRLALAVASENTDVWVVDLSSRAMTQLTFDKATDYQPIWTPDGKQVLFWSGRESDIGGIFSKNADGTGKDRKLVSYPDVTT